MGSKITGVSTFKFDEKILTGVTLLHIAIYKRFPDVLACLLKANDMDAAMAIKCKDGRNTEYSPLQLAVQIDMNNGDIDTDMVGNMCEIT